MKRLLLLSCSVFVWLIQLNSQDTFSIVAVDSVTGEVGSAGASCVDLTSFPGLSDDFLGELFPGVGAINTQAFYNPDNQANARERMNAGDTPSEIISWLFTNDVQGLPQFRQYGIVGLVNGIPEAVAFTGASTDDYKDHITGPNYAIQGNILLGQEILDSMEARFLSAEGDLACKLMAALQGANVVGADTRCTANGTSSLFAFVKVAQPDDTFGDPSFVLSVRTSDGDEIEPIDSLQTLFDAERNCIILGNTEINDLENQFQVYPNPFNDQITVSHERDENLNVEILDVNGKLIYSGKMKGQLEISTVDLDAGVYFIKVTDGNSSITRKVIKN